MNEPGQVLASSETQIHIPQISRWQVRSTLLNLGQSETLLCERENGFAVIERFRGDSLYAKANGNAEILLYSQGLKNVRTLKKHSLAVWSAAFSSDGSLIATASMDDKVLLWRNDTAEVIGSLEGHKEGVSGVAFSPDNKTLAALCGNRSVKLWNVPTQREVANLSFSQMSAYVEFSPDGETLVAWKPWIPEPRFEFWHTRSPRRN